MAILNQTQLVAASNATYIDNTSGSITPTAVRTLNNDWISSSILAPVTASMSVASASFAGTASFALNFNPSATASYALQALNATNATLADTATFATNASTANSANTAVSSNTAISASFASTASFALNFNPSATASYALFALTASYALNVPTASVSASYAQTASLAQQVSTSISSQNIQHNVLFVDTTGPGLVQVDGGLRYNPNTNLLTTTASLASLAEVATTAINATTASYASNAELLDNLNFTAFVLTSSFSPFSGSIAGRVTTLETAGYATLGGNNTFTGNNIFGNITASNALVLSASIEYLFVQYETASVIYSSGSNQFGDAANDTQTLWGTVNVVTGPLLVTGSAIITGSLAVSTTGVEFQVLPGGVTIGNSQTDVHSITGSLNVTGSTLLNGSATLKPSVSVTEYPFTISQVSDGTSTNGNLISTRNTSVDLSGSVIVSGSQNLILLSGGGDTSVNGIGASNGFNGINSIVTAVPFITGSNGSGYDRPLPSFVNSVVNRFVNVTDNRPATGSTPLTLTSVNSNSVINYTTSTGSVSLTNANLAGTGVQITVTGSSGASKTIQSIGVIGNTNALLIDSPSAATSYAGLFIAGTSNTVLVSGSNTTMQSANLIGYQLRATGSAAATTNYGSLYAGRWNASDNTSLTKETAFAVGTGTSNTARRTSFHVSASGLTTIANSLEITGFVDGNVVSASITSNTSSIDFSQGNFYTSLVSGSTNFNITNPKAGQTLNLLLTTQGVATASFSSNVKQVSGSRYTPTSGSSNDVLTFISWDGTSVYLANVKNLI